LSQYELAYMYGAEVSYEVEPPYDEEPP